MGRYTNYSWTAEFESLPEMAERDIFREFWLFMKVPKMLIPIGLLTERVQMGMALTPAEKLQALNTPYVKYISILLKQHSTLR